MRLSFLFLFVFISFSLISLSGCGGKDDATSSSKDPCAKCDDNNKCTTKLCSELTDFQCVTKEIPGCHIGNLVCEPDLGENSCTAESDCDPCKGTVKGSKYLAKSCVNEVCLEDINPNSIKPITSTNKVSVAGNAFRVITKFPTPFNLKKNLFEIQVKVDTVAKSVDKISLDSIEVSGQDGKLAAVLGEYINERPMPTVGNEIEFSFPLDSDVLIAEREIKNLKVTYKFTITTRSISGVPQISTQQGVVNFPGIPFIAVKPSVDYPCPNSCDDGISGTRDHCGADTRFFCQHDPIVGVCGNLVCESGENKCNCAVDCGACEGAAGVYTLYGCQNMQCIAQLNPGTVKKSQPFFEQISIGTARVDSRILAPSPLESGKDTVSIELSVFTQGTVQAIQIRDVQLLDGTTELSKISVNQPLGMGTPVTMQLPVPAPAEVEESNTLSAQVWYDVTITDKTSSSKYTKSLGRITVVRTG